MNINNKIIQLYNKNVPIRELSRKLHVSRDTIRKVLLDNNIRIKGSREASILRGYFKEKKKFNLSNKEKAYLFGLVMGDLTPVIKSKYTLKLITHTTHPHFIKLLENIFRIYGPVSSKKNKDNQFRFNSYLDLESFSFLLESKREKLPNWINKSNLFNFLAGFIDSDGSVYIRKTGIYFQYIIRFFSQNLEILKWVKMMLEDFGYDVSIHKNHYKGFTSYHNGRKFSYNKDYYTIEIYKKDQVLDLLKIIPIRHPEKIAKMKLMFKINKEKLIHFNNIKNKIKILNEKIEESVKSQVLNTLN